MADRLAGREVDRTVNRPADTVADTVGHRVADKAELAGLGEGVREQGVDDGARGLPLQGQRGPRGMPETSSDKEVVFQERLRVFLALVNRVLLSLHRQVFRKALEVPFHIAPRPREEGVSLGAVHLPVQRGGAAAPDAVRLAYEALLALYHLVSHGLGCI